MGTMDHAYKHRHPHIRTNDGHKHKHTRSQAHTWPGYTPFSKVVQTHASTKNKNILLVYNTQHTNAH